MVVWEAGLRLSLGSFFTWTAHKLNGTSCVRPVPAPLPLLPPLQNTLRLSADHTDSSQLPVVPARIMASPTTAVS